jgi:uncharacterized protein involved in exopolysaccharide biosynthesis
MAQAHDPNLRVDAAAADEAESEGMDLEQLREKVGFVFRAARRRPKVAVLTFVIVASLGVTVGATMPRTYSAEVKLLAQKTSAIRVLSSQTPQMTNEDNPTKNVAQMIQKRDNITALVKEYNLWERFRDTRPAALKFKDRVTGAVFGPPSDEDMRMVMIYTLEKALEVTTDEPTSTFVIKIDWSNARIAYDLVTLLQKNFLEAKYDGDVAVINDSIVVLEDHARNELTHVDTELDAYQKIVADRAAKAALTKTTLIGGGHRLFVASPAGSVGATAAVADDTDLPKALEEKRQQIRGAEEAHQRQIELLRQQLMQAQATLTPMHPSVIALQDQLAAAMKPSPELAQLRSEERELMTQIVQSKIAAAAPPVALPSTTVRADGPTKSSDGQEAPDASVAAPLPMNLLERDGPLQLAASKLTAAIRAYQEATSRLDAAQVELDITRAVYKHRYSVVTPAEVPKKPKKPTAQIIAGGSIVFAALLALLLAAGSDLLSGSILEAWQVRRQLKLDVIGELDRGSS